jgi:hypothetical protein
MLNYELMLKLNLPDFMVFDIYVDYRFTAVIVFEDLHRPGELMRDFPEYAGLFCVSEEEWDDFRNLIHAKIFFLRKTDFDKRKLRNEVCYIAHRMIELKPDVNTKITPVYDKAICKCYTNEDLANYILSISERYKDYTGTIEGVGNLSQKIKLISK